MKRHGLDLHVSETLTSVRIVARKERTRSVDRCGFWEQPLRLAANLQMLSLKAFGCFFGAASAAMNSCNDLQWINKISTYINHGSPYSSMVKAFLASSESDSSSARHVHDMVRWSAGKCSDLRPFHSWCREQAVIWMIWMIWLSSWWSCPYFQAVISMCRWF